jgi:hypothetical protein
MSDFVVYGAIMEKTLHFHLSSISNRQGKLIPMIAISMNLKTTTQKADENAKGFYIISISLMAAWIVNSE